MRALELFAGAGGAALGIERAGLDHAALVEWDDRACDTLAAAGLGPVVRADVRDLEAIASVVETTEDRAWQRAGDALLDSDLDGEAWTLAREELAMQMLEDARRIFLMWSSWPCQPWSTAGSKRGASDERNGWPWTVNAIDRFRPRWFLGENVRGLLEHREEGHPDPFRCPRCYLESVIVPQLQSRFEYAGWFLID